MIAKENGGWVTCARKTSDEWQTTSSSKGHGIIIQSTNREKRKIEIKIITDSDYR